jgi:hypothetical protein
MRSDHGIFKIVLPLPLRRIGGMAGWEGEESDNDPCELR